VHFNKFWLRETFPFLGKTVPNQVLGTVFSRNGKVSLNQNLMKCKPIIEDCPTFKLLLKKQSRASAEKFSGGPNGKLIEK